MKRYEKYKPSGIPWIGEVPEHWELICLKRTVSLVKERAATENVPYVELENIEGFSGRLLSTSTAEPESQCTLFQTGDVLFCKLRPYLTKCFRADFAGKCTTELLVLRPARINGAYLKYLFLTSGFVNLINASTYGAKMPRANWTFIGQCNICIPSLPEQRDIVAFLDGATGKIDAYIAEKLAEIEKLLTLKQALIARAVTKGLNPHATMKDSGIPWIGDVPEHWEVFKIGQKFRERRVKVSDKEFMPLSVAKIGVVPQLEDACKTDNGDNRKLVRVGDFVVNSRSDRKGSCGVSSYDGSVSLINIVLTPMDINRQYIHHLFRSNDYIEEFYRYGRGIVADLWTTRYSEMKNISIPVPPTDEQREIVDHIDKKSAKIDAFIASIKEQIEKLKLYKQRLISDAVTGKIKVSKNTAEEI